MPTQKKQQYKPPVDTPEKLREKPLPEPKPFEQKTPMTVEKAIVNFTKLPEKMLEMILKIDQNFTDLNDPEIQKKMEEEQLKKVRERLQSLNEEVDIAKQTLEEEKLKKQQEEEEEERKRLQEEQQEKEASSQVEPTTKQKRGIFGKKKKAAPTIENKASKGKQ